MHTFVQPQAAHVTCRFRRGPQMPTLMPQYCEFYGVLANRSGTPKSTLVNFRRTLGYSDTVEPCKPTTYLDRPSQTAPRGREQQNLSGS